MHDDASWGCGLAWCLGPVPQGAAAARTLLACARGPTTAPGLQSYSGQARKRPFRIHGGSTREQHRSGPSPPQPPRHRVLLGTLEVLGPRESHVAGLSVMPG